MKDDKELLEQCLDFWYAEGKRPIGGAEDMQTVIDQVRQHDRERLREAVHTAERYDTHLFNEKEVIAMIDEVLT